MSIRNNGRERKHFKLTEKDKQYIRETCKKMRIEQVNENEPAIDECAFIGSITMTSSGAFEECYGLKSIVLPNSLEAIGHNAFMVCLSLESIEIPIGVTQIGTYAFLGCASLEELRYAGTTKQWADIVKGSNWNMQSGIKVVHCLDGDAQINE